MARDNGKRGSYRHVSGSLTKTPDSLEPKLVQTSPVAASPSDSNASTPLANGYKNLKRDTIDDLGLLGDGFFESVPNSLNAKYPTMAVPGSMPLWSLSTHQVGRDCSPTWTEMIFAAGFWSFAIFSFFFTMYSGFSDIVAYIWALIAGLLGKGV